MNALQIVEVLAAIAVIGLGVWQYRKRDAQGARYGSQGGVILMAIGVLVLIHGLGLMDYRPSPAELGQ